MQAVTFFKHLQLIFSLVQGFLREVMLETLDHLKSTTGTNRTMRKTVQPADIEKVVKTKIPVTRNIYT